MIERPKPSEVVNNPESENAVFNSTLLLNHDSAANFIIDKINTFPIKRVIIFGEPGVNKTTILLQLVSEAVKADPRIEPTFIFYDDSLAKIKKELAVGNLSKNQYSLVSDDVSSQMQAAFPALGENQKTRQIQFVEVVGISNNDRGTSSLTKAALRLKGQNPIEQDTLIIGVAADTRSLKDAGALRKTIAKLDNPMDVFDVLSKNNVCISDYPKDLPIQEIARQVVAFYGKMATEEKIEIIHTEVMGQAARRAAGDEYRLFRMLRLPKVPFPIEDRVNIKNYLLNPAFLQTYLNELGLKPDVYNTSANLLRDTGIVIFSPYNPDLPKQLDLSKVLNKSCQ